MAIKAVLFDFDGTLADTLELSFYAFTSIFKKYDNRDVSTEQLIAMFGPTEDGIITENLAHKESIPEAIAEYYEIYRAGHAAQVHSSDDMHKLLHYLKSNRIQMGVITGKSRRAFDISVESLGMSDFFDIVITGDDVQKAKPDPEGIRIALAFLGVSKDEAVFVGDSNADIKAGKAAEVRTYGVQWLSTYQSFHFEVEPDLIFTKVGQFLELLRGGEIDQEISGHHPR